MKKTRMHQFLSKTGQFSSKKVLITAIKQGNVTLDGTVITNPNYQFAPGKAIICYQGKELATVTETVYLLLNKPTGYLSSRLTASDAALHKRSVFSLLDEDTSLSEAVKQSLVCVGRLDEDTSGLLILTNDGKLVASLAHPSKNVAKVYRAALAAPLTAEQQKAIEGRITIELEENGIITPYTTAPCTIHICSPDRKTVEITLTEGKKREVRRMFEAAGNQVVSLERTAIGRISLAELHLSRGKYVQVEKESIAL